MGDISMNTNQPNSGDTQAVFITHQESPSDLSGPTIDDSMPSGKENKLEKIAIFMPLTKIINNSINTSFFCKCLEQVPLRTLLNSLNMPHWRDKVICHHNPTFPSHRSCSRTYHHFNNWNEMAMIPTLGSITMLQSMVKVLLKSMNQTFLKLEHPVLLRLVFQTNRMLATSSIFLKNN